MTAERNQQHMYETLSGTGSAGLRPAYGSDSAEVIAGSRRRERAEIRKVYCDYSLGVFSKGNTVRHACIRIVESPVFEAAIIAAIAMIVHSGRL